MLKKIKKIISRDFFKNVLTLMTGTAIAQIITVTTIPILSRLFTPEEFGVFAVFLSLTSLITSISAGRYELAIMLPKKNINAYHVLIISIWFVFISTIISFIILFVFFKPISELFEFENYRYFVFLVPISIFFQGTYKVFNNWFSRFKNFKDISFSKVVKTFTGTGSKISLSYINFGALGLAIGDTTSHFFASLFLLIKNKKSQTADYKIDAKLLKQELKEYKDFPLFSMPMAFLNSVSTNVLVYFLTIAFNSTIVGLYSQANKVINFPLTFLSNSFTSVFYQKITTTNKKIQLYMYSYLSSFFIATIILLPIVFFGEQLFCFVLGNKWEYSGHIAKLLVPLAVAGFATRNTSSIFLYLNLQRLTLIWQVIYLTVAVSIFYFFKGKELEEILLIFSFWGAFMYIGLAFVGYKRLKQKD